ncbi:hypothetical protein HanRHA438_Chr10g0442701 [Helianthus annuus]|nr:hypothetical protein HanRHA438_Chr10g0442701 [Helianthus annuus]
MYYSLKNTRYYYLIRVSDVYLIPIRLPLSLSLGDSETPSYLHQICLRIFFLRLLLMVVVWLSC